MRAALKAALGALRQALPLIASSPVLVMNGDSLCTADLRAFWAWHCATGAGGSLLLTRVADTARYGAVEVDAQGRIVAFHEKTGARGAGWINAGVYLLSKDLIAAIPAGRAVSIRSRAVAVR